MKFKCIGFSANGKLKGNIILVDENDEPMGWESSGDWSSLRHQTQSMKQLMAVLNITEDKAIAMIIAALKEARRIAGIPNEDDNSDLIEHTLPCVVVSDRQPRDIEADAWKLLSPSENSSPEYFRLGNVLVYLEKNASGISLIPLNIAGLRGRLKNLADFVAYVGYGDNMSEKPAVVPRTMLEDMLAVAHPPVPSISAIARCPVLSPSSRLLVADGYYHEFSLYVYTGCDITIPDNPSTEDILAARDYVFDELLPDFPFASESDKANVLAEFLTPIVRPFINGPTPLFMIEAPQRGTGKGLLCQVVSEVTTGGKIAVMTEGESEDEWRKRITAKLKDAPDVVLIDNVKGRLESAALSSALTESIWEDREMGFSRLIRVPIRCTWMANGNNPVVNTEIARRIVRIRIDAQIERPEERSGFKHDLERGWALQNRDEILSRLLILVQAWISQGKPAGKMKMGRFDEWVSTIGGILELACVSGFLENREEVYKLSELEDESWRAFVAAWFEAYEDKREGVDLLLELATERKLLVDLRGGRSKHGAAVAMGKELMSRRDRRLGKFVIRYAGSAHGVNYFRLENILRENDSNAKTDPAKNQPNPPNQPLI